MDSDARSAAPTENSHSDHGAVTLWHFAFSHFNEKVRWALDHKQIAYRSEMLVPGLHVPAMRKLSGQQRTPVIRLDGQLVVDSTAILLRLEERFPQPPLLPTAANERARALALEGRFDRCFGADVRTLFYDAYWPEWGNCSRMSAAFLGAGAERQFRWLFPVLKPLLFFTMGLGKGRVAAASERVFGALDELERERAGQPYLVGDGFSLADLTAAALLAPLVGASQFPYPLPTPLPAGLVQLRARAAEHGAIGWARQIYRDHRPPSKATPR